MKLIIHDLREDMLQKIYPHIAPEDMVISDNGDIHSCIGCFGCWLKTPGACIIQDPYGQMGKNIAMCSELLIISQCVYGSYSPFVKNVLDRSISYIHPYFTVKNGEMHHQQRYKRDFHLKVIFYGDSITDPEKDTAEKLVRANSVNLYCKVDSVTFLDSIQKMEALNI